MDAKLEERHFPTTEIRPGITFPDWGVVRSAQARDALVAILGAFRADEYWRGYSADEDVVRSSIIRHFAKTGSAPSLSELNVATGIPEDALKGLLRQLRDRDLVVMEAERVVGAYPLTDKRTEHEVRIAGQTVHAMCAVDALGVGAMLDEDIEIFSSCRQCGAPITVTTQGSGTALATFAPSEALVWSGARTAAGCAADTLRTVIAFFCCDAHLDVWQGANQPNIDGYRLSLDAAHQVGRAMFAPTLARDPEVPGRKIGAPMIELLLQSTITCPACGFASAETMPTDACLFFYDCKKCGAQLKPKKGDCCVFCSYGTVPCPPMQSEHGCCK